MISRNYLEYLNYNGKNKLRITIDTNGLPHAIRITIASITERAGVIISKLPWQLVKCLKYPC